MAWQPNNPDGSPPRRGNAVAWLALLFSLLALGGFFFLFLSTYDNGELGQKLRDRGSKLKDNFQTLKDETSKALKSGKKGDGAVSVGAGSSTPAADAPSGGDVKWDKIQERLDRLKGMIGKGDERARDYMEKLKDDLSALRDYSTEKGSTSLDKAMKELQAAREKLEAGAGEASRKLKSIGEKSPDDAKDAAPEAADPNEETRGDDKPAPTPRAARSKTKAPPVDSDKLPDLPPPPTEEK